MARGKRTDPTAAILVTVMHQMGFTLELITTASGLPRGTVKDIIQGNGPWGQMAYNEFYKLTRQRLIRVIDEGAYELGMNAMARLRERMKTASFTELMGIMDVALNIRGAWK